MAPKQCLAQRESRALGRECRKLGEWRPVLGHGRHSAPALRAQGGTLRVDDGEHGIVWPADPRRAATSQERVVVASAHASSSTFSRHMMGSLYSVKLESAGSGSG